MKLRHLKQRFRLRGGHRPGRRDIRTDRDYIGAGFGTDIVGPSTLFLARANFFYFEGCGRPCYLPLNPAPRIGNKDWAVTEGWPCEYYVPSSHKKPDDGPYCFDKAGKDGDWVRVIGQVRGQPITNDIGQVSDVWDVIKISDARATRNRELAESHRFVSMVDPGFIDEGPIFFIVYAPDIWLGNTGWHEIPWQLPEDTKKLLRD